MAKIKGPEGPTIGISAPLLSGGSNRLPDENAGMTRIGATVADIAEAFSTANARADLQAAKAEAYAKLISTRESLNDETDPEAMKPKWEQAATQIQHDFSQRFKDNDRALSDFNAWFTEHKARGDVDVSGLFRSRTIDRGRASAMQNEDVLLSTLNAGSQPKDYDWTLELHEDDLRDKFQTGVYSAAEAEQRRQIFKGALDKMRNENLEEQRINGVHATLAKTFGKNPNGAVSYLENPDNWAALGISHKEALHFISVFDQQSARAKRRADEARAAGERSEKEAYFRALEKDDFDGAAAVLRKSRNIPGNERAQMRAALSKDQWSDDPKTAAEIQRGVWTGQITDVSQITPYVGNGLSLKTARTLREDLDKMNKDAPDFPGAMNFYGNALGRYKALYKDTPLAEQEAKFAQTLAWQAKQQKIGPYDPRMDGLADELLKVTEKNWFSSDKTRFEQQFEAGTLPGVPKPGQPAVPTAAPARPVSSLVSAPIPRAEYEAVKQALARAGKDTSDATVTAVWKANRDKLKGAR